MAVGQDRRNSRSGRFIGVATLAGWLVSVLGASAIAGGPNVVEGAPRGLFVVGADGTGLRLVASPGPDTFRQAAYPAWSPDGRSLAFTAFDASGRTPEIRVVPVDGGPGRVVARGIMPSWSADGARLAYVASGKPDFATDWSRLGRNDERIEVVHLSGLSAGRVEVITEGLWPRFAPDDDRLAFVDRRRTGWDVFVRSADGLALIRLTDDPAMDTEPIWSPDGREVVFLSSRGVRWDLYRAGANGRGEVHRLTNHPSREDHATLSPDGLRVAFTDRLGRPESRILVLDLTTDTTRSLLPISSGDRDPVWSPDGRSIAFVSQRPSR